MSAGIMESMFFESWHNLARIVVITVLAYIAIIFFLRMSGKRTLAKMKAFDFIITVALGSSLATVSLSRDIPLAEGVLAFLLLITMQYIVTWLSVRYRWVREIVSGTPSLLYYKGDMILDVMKKERITSDDLYEKTREKGFSGLEGIDAIILETTGDITIIPQIESDITALENVRYSPWNKKNEKKRYGNEI